MAQLAPPVSPVPVPLGQSNPAVAVLVSPRHRGHNRAASQAQTSPTWHSLWAALIARIYEVLPLIWPHCGGAMRIVASITFSAD